MQDKCLPQLSVCFKIIPYIRVTNGDLLFLQLAEIRAQKPFEQMTVRDDSL